MALLTVAAGSQRPSPVSASLPRGSPCPVLLKCLLCHCLIFKDQDTFFFYLKSRSVSSFVGRGEILLQHIHKWSNGFTQRIYSPLRNLRGRHFWQPHFVSFSLSLPRPLSYFPGHLKHCILPFLNAPSRKCFMFQVEHVPNTRVCETFWEVNLFPSSPQQRLCILFAYCFDSVLFFQRNWETIQRISEN